MPISSYLDSEIFLYAKFIKIEKASEIKINQGDAPQNMVLIPPNEQSYYLNATIIDYLDTVDFESWSKNYPTDFPALPKDKLFIRLFVPAINPQCLYY